jgi:hypothetical protein
MEPPGGPFEVEAYDGFRRVKMGGGRGAGRSGDAASIISRLGVGPVRVGESSSSFSSASYSEAGGGCAIGVNAVGVPGR